MALFSKKTFKNIFVIAWIYVLSVGAQFTTYYLGDEIYDYVVIFGLPAALIATLICFKLTLITVFKIIRLEQDIDRGTDRIIFTLLLTLVFTNVCAFLINL